MARRKQAASRRGSSKKNGGSSAITWFFVGLLMGLALAVFGFHKGYLPAPPQAAEPERNAPPAGEPELLEGTDSIVSEDKPEYDFYTVLPEMEVVVPQQGKANQAEPEQAQTGATGQEQFMLQAGSFLSAEDAEQRKAQLALMGQSAVIQQGTVDGGIRYRVRIGPVQGTRKAEEIRQRLADNKIEVLILKASSQN